MNATYWVEGDAPHLSNLDWRFDTFEEAVEEAKAMLYEDDEMTKIWVSSHGRTICKARVFGNGKVHKLDY
jgi:hypothetical protein